MKISEIYPHVKYDHEITSLATHSKAVQPGSIFFAIIGYQHDGHLYIDEAIEKGAITIVVEKQHFIITPHHVNVIEVHNCRKELAIIAQKLYQSDLENLPIIAITGTNGKTTVSTLIAKYLSFLGYKTLLIGSNGNYYQNIKHSTTNTTPELTAIYQLIHQYRTELDFCVIEVSSQAIRELRVLGLPFSSVLITNISQDHFDYHPNWEDYLFSKGLLLAQLGIKPKRVVVLNRNMRYFHFFNQLTIQPVISFGIESGDYEAKIIEKNLEATKFQIKKQDRIQEFETSLLGSFNVENATAVYALVDSLGLDITKFGEFLATNPQIPGRMEQFQIDGRHVIVDYAHTPEAVLSVMQFLRSRVEGRLKVLIGCGGHRDRKKRPLMANHAMQYGDWVYFTQDNSRGEAWSQIIGDMLEGCSETNYSVIPDRYQAIQAMMAESSEGDTLVLFGMGHEEYVTSEGLLSDIKIMQKLKEISRGNKH